MNFKKPRVWLGTVAIITLIGISLLLLTNGQSKPVDKDDTNEVNVNSKQITDYAWEIINRDITNYESNPEVQIKDSKITRLEVIESFDALSDTSIDVYALEYRLLPEDLRKVVLAGGRQVDEDGWLKETSSMGSPLLIISCEIDSVELELVGTLWTGGVVEEGGLESSIRDLLIRKDIDELISVIISSPLTSSSTGDYIKNHQKEYDEIILMGEKALPYLIGILDGGDKGLKGNIVWQLCEDIIKNLKLTGEFNSVTKQLVNETITSMDKWKGMMGYAKVQEYLLETFVINDCLIKDGPGDNYKTIGNLKYGDIVFTSGKYNEWIKCITNNGEKEFWVKSANLIDELQQGSIIWES